MIYKTARNQQRFCDTIGIAPRKGRNCIAPLFTNPVEGNRAVLSDEDAAHITRHCGCAEAIKLLSATAAVLIMKASSYSVGEEVQVEIQEKHPSDTEPSARITLYQALPKGDKMEWIIQKAVELGVYRVVPVLTSRCVSRPDGKVCPGR